MRVVYTLDDKRYTVTDTPHQNLKWPLGLGLAPTIHNDQIEK